MSDEEEVMSGEDAGGRPAAPEDSGPSEAELAMQRRRAQKMDSSALDEEAQELLEANKELRSKMEEEINEMRERSERRKKEREEEERQMAERRAEEEARRKKEEEERSAKKNAEEAAKRAARDAKMAEFEKWKNVSTPNFIITKKSGDVGGDEDDDEEQGEKKSKEQLEAEKRAILDQRTPKLEISGFDSSKLTEKAKELHNLIVRLESEKYDLEKRFKTQQYDMMELAERARQMNKVGRGGLKRVQLLEEDVDIMGERFAGCPSKIVMYSQFERQKDSRNWNTRQGVFTGAHILYPAEKIAPTRIVKFDEGTGLPEYIDIPGAGGEEAGGEEE